MVRFRSLLLSVFAIVIPSLTLAQSLDPDLDSAMKGDPAAQIRLAKAYQFGEGRPKDMRESVRWFQAAAAKGNAEAAYTLGTLAYNGNALGDNVAQSDISAWVWFKVAEEEGYPDAREAAQRSEADLPQFKLVDAHERLAVVFINGKVAPANQAAATRELEWLQAHESRQGTLLLAHIYLAGRGVPKDLDKAQALCEKVSKQGLSGGYYCLSLIYDEKGDAKSAFEALKKDAMLAYPQATLALIDRYHNGVGTAPDPVMALSWAIVAEQGRLVKGAEMRQKIASELTEKQQKEAAKRAEKLPRPEVYQPGLRPAKK